MKTAPKPVSSGSSREPNRLVVSRKYLLAYASGIDFSVPESVPESSIAVRRILDSMSNDERIASALELHPTGMKRLYADFVKTEVPKHSKDFGKEVQAEFGFIEELLPAHITLCDTCLMPLTEEDIEGVEGEDQIRALAIKDSIGRFYVFLRKVPMENQGTKLRGNLQAVQGGLTKWIFWHDFRNALVPKGSEDSVVEYLRTLPLEEQIRQVKKVLKRLLPK